jgi:hypothetical protein
MMSEACSDKIVKKVIYIHVHTHLDHLMSQYRLSHVTA